MDLFDRDDFSGMRILEIGAGNGMLSITIAALGAQEVIAIEPELDGAHSGVKQIFQNNIRDLKLDNIKFFPVSFDGFTAEPESFDRILMYAVINHLDEEHAKDLNTSAVSQNCYIDIFRAIRKLLKSGGELVFYDCARSHALAPFIKSGIIKRHPIYSTIEWEKHQNPSVWENVLLKAGYSRINYFWGQGGLAKYQIIRAIIRCNPFISWLMFPYFTLRAKR